MLGWSSPSTGPTVLVSAWLRSEMIILHHPCTTAVDVVEYCAVHMCRIRCTCLAELTRASPHRVLIGTVALDRMGKHLLVAQHHFRHPGAPRSACCMVPSRLRLPLRRKASRSQAMATGASPASVTASPVPLCCVGVRTEAARHRSCHPLPPVRRGGSAPRGPLADRWQRGWWPLTANEALATRAGPSHGLVGPVPLRCGG